MNAPVRRIDGEVQVLYRLAFHANHQAIYCKMHTLLHSGALFRFWFVSHVWMPFCDTVGWASPAASPHFSFPFFPIPHHIA